MNLLEDLNRVLEERVESQRRKVFAVVRRLDPKLTWDDVANPDGIPVLRDSAAFHYEDGILAGLLSAQIQVRARLREIGAGGEEPRAPSPPHVHDDGTIEYRFCPRCGGELDPRQLVPHEPPRLICRRCSFVYYLNPKVATGVIVRQGGGIVLGRRSIEPRAGSWGFPSGYVDRGERVEDAACREAREEVGLELAIEDLVGVYSYSGRPVVVVVYSGRVTGGELIAGHETSEVAAFPEAEIPWADLAFPSTAQALRDYLGEGLPAAGPGGGGSDK